MAETFYFDRRNYDFICRHVLSKENISNISAHSHFLYELIYLKKGKISYVVEGRTYHIGANTLIFTRPGETHSITVEDDVYERYNILFGEDGVGPELLSKISKGLDVIQFAGNEIVADIFKKFDYYQINDEGEFTDEVLFGLTKEILYNILMIQNETSSEYTSNPVIEQAIDYINMNIREPITIEKLCGDVFITKSHLHHLFVKHLNMTPKRYIIMKKLRMVRRELQMGGNPTEVCLAYGFTNYSTFYRNYKRCFGCMPSDALKKGDISEIL